MLTNSRLPLFLAVIAIQLGGILYLPVRSSLIRAHGKEIALELAPVDPYDMLTGYSVDIAYRASMLDSYPALSFSPSRGQTLYVTLQRGAGRVWDPVSVSADWPTSTAPNQVVMKGVYDNRDWSYRIWFGIEKMYIPEARRGDIDLPEVTFTPAGDRARMPADAVRADVRVDADGDASLMRLHVRDQVFE